MRRLTHIPLVVVLLLVALLALATGVLADNTDPNSSGSRYAWGENIGWLSARPTTEAYGPGGAGAMVSDTDVTGYLWGENIGWVNLSCKNNNTCAGAAGNWGVKNDGLGTLSGYAWGENVGWISFSCQNAPATCAANGNFGVKITNYGVTTEHALSGVFTGYAWGENIGWISFNCSNDASCTRVAFKVQTGAPDSDGDGYTDAQEIALGKNPWTYCRTMRADVNGDGKVNILDVAIIASKYNQLVPPATARYDQNADGKINILDLAIAASVYNQQVATCP